MSKITNDGLTRSGATAAVKRPFVAAACW